MQNTDYQYKIDGYEALFKDPSTGELRVFTHGAYRVRVALAMYNADASAAPLKYSAYWYDSPAGILQQACPK
jgi:hypothetical protein